MDVRWPRTRLSAKFVLSDAAGDAIILVNWCWVSLLMISIYILFELYIVVYYVICVLHLCLAFEFNSYYIFTGIVV